ncbi:hypothetical protein [Streptomyces sp. NPDC051014]|uniref:hypothetical protein n=1 Tax=Streptomyces sp. NPDC051014 TaxID=3155751 RepID=UPI0033CB9CB5
MTEVDDVLVALAKEIPSAFPEIEWTSYDVLQCLVEDVPHDFHAAFLRSGSRADPASDVYLCWSDGPGWRGIAELDCCLKLPDPMGSACTIFKEHPGRCAWDYVDPAYVAALAVADQLSREWCVKLLRGADDLPPL